MDVKTETEIAPGVVLLPAPGHSPHSVVVLIISGDQQMLYASDTTLLVQQNSIEPDWVSAFEYDGPLLVKTRRQLLERAAADKIFWFGYHAPFPALGNIKKTAKSYEFVQSSWHW